MPIHLEKREPNAIRSYSNEYVKIGDATYEHSVIVSKDVLIPWPVRSLAACHEDALDAILSLKPEVILIGHAEPRMQLPQALLKTLSQKRIGFECMSIGAACRTFNILLNEQREVVAGIILNAN